MQGSHDPGIVALSYLIASLAGYVAIAFASRMFARQANRLPWLIGGALTMGTGIWSMHFIGMTALSLPIPISYDIGITLLSWIAAVVVSALALFIVGYGHVRASTVALGAIIMGIGICVMHYSGMWAMRMFPAINYDPALLAASAVIAVVASGAALLIIAYLKQVRSQRDVTLRVIAALIMGVAVCGTHYTGMAAAEFAEGAFCSTSNQLPAQSLTGPTTIGTLLILGLGIYFTISDRRGIAHAQRAERQLNARVQFAAFTDREIGLPNRAGISQAITERAHLMLPEGFTVVTFRIETHDGNVPELSVMQHAAESISQALPQAVLSRTRPEQLVLLLNGDKESVMRDCTLLIERLERNLASRNQHVLLVNSAHCPSEGDNAQWLLLRASPKATSDGVPNVA